MKEFYTIKKGNNNIFRAFLILLLIYLVSILMSFVFNPQLQLYEKIFIFAIYFFLFLIFLKSKNSGFYALAVVIPFNLFISILFPFVSKFNLYSLDLIITLLLVVWILGLLKTSTFKLKRTKIDSLLALLVLASFISIFPHILDFISEFAREPVQSAFNLIFKEAYSVKLLFGLNMLHRTITFALFYFYVVNNTNAEKVRKFFLVLLSSFSIIAVISIASFFASDSGPVRMQLDGGNQYSRILIDSEFYNQRSSFPFPHPNALAGYSLLNISIPLAFFILSRRLKIKLLWGIILLLFAAGFSFTQSRAALLGLNVSAFSAFIFLMVKFKRKLFAASAAVALIMLIVLSYMVIDLRGLADVYKSPEYSLNDKYKETLEVTTRPEGRLNLIWPTTINMIKDNFFIGVGLGMYSREYENYLSKRNARYTNEIHAHNFYLHAFAELGIIGFVAYMAIFYIILKTALLYLINKNKIINWDYYIVFPIFIGVTALLIHSLFDNLLFWREIAALFWMQTAFLFVITGKYNRGQ